MADFLFWTRERTPTSKVSVESFLEPVDWTCGKVSVMLMLRTPKGGRDIDHLGLFGISGESPLGLIWT